MLSIKLLSRQVRSCWLIWCGLALFEDLVLLDKLLHKAVLARILFDVQSLLLFVGWLLLDLQNPPSAGTFLEELLLISVNSGAVKVFLLLLNSVLTWLRSLVERLVEHADALAVDGHAHHFVLLGWNLCPHHARTQNAVIISVSTAVEVGFLVDLLFRNL